MNDSSEPQAARVTGFRTRLRVAIMLVVTGVTLSALYLAERSLAARVAEDLEGRFEAQLAAVTHAQEVRSAALVERCRALVRKPRIRAALEDDALDLLYPNAEDELRDLMVPGDSPAATPVLSARFYRFLDAKGAVIAPPSARAIGDLGPEEQASLALPQVPAATQVGCLPYRINGVDTLAMLMVTPIVATETAGIIGAIVIGFRPFAPAADGITAGMKRGILIAGRLQRAGLAPEDFTAVERALPGIRLGSGASWRRSLDAVPHLLFTRHLNPDSLFPAVHEVCAYPLTGLVAHQRRLRWQVLGAGALLLLLGLGGSHVVATRLAPPVERLAVHSEEQRTRRARAEAALEATSAELQRSARFSADASHQLKTPVTVLRAGLEELLARDKFTAAECQEISALVHQTYRLSSLIEDLLLLSRMDSGRLKLDLVPVDLSQLIEASLDDLGASPGAFAIDVQTDFPAGLHVLGEKRYLAMVLQNLLENARKYNRPAGWISIRAAAVGGRVTLTVGNSGPPIPPAAQAHVFERFHRGSVGENVPGYGLGLNLARELVRLHRGDLRLVRSDAEGTVFEARFLPATGSGPDGPSP